jgi:hypothetical protein
MSTKVCNVICSLLLFTMPSIVLLALPSFTVLYHILLGIATLVHFLFDFSLPRNIAWDQSNEVMNKDMKEAKPNSTKRIDAVITMLNGMRSVDAAMRCALGMERDDPTEYTQVKMSHVHAIVTGLEGSLGLTRLPLHGIHPSNFGAGPRPWVTINAHGGNLIPTQDPNGTRKSAASDWIVNKLNEAPYPMAD